jgi:PIN domain nuclease of toxin-antitoxin system
VRLLLDTHAFPWWRAGESTLSPAARKAIGEGKNTIFISAASAWEIAIKYRIGKLPGVPPSWEILARSLLIRDLPIYQ